MSTPPPASTVISILGLPKGSSLMLNGQAMLLQRDDFVGIQGIPLGLVAFSLVVIRAAAAQDQGNQGAVSVGFWFGTAATTTSEPLALLRKFDPITEEVSSQLVDSTTAQNLKETLVKGQIEPQRMIPYSQLCSNQQTQEWIQLTQFISSRLLLQLRNIQTGSKLIPGCYGDDPMEPQQATPNNHHQQQDGSSVSYPAIPVLSHHNHSSIRHSTHRGTKHYLAQLSPSQRTALFTHATPCNKLFRDIYQQYYQQSYTDVLGDLQLAFVLFLYLQCLSSLEHWRDLLALLCSVDEDCIEQQLDLYRNLCSVLAGQVTKIDSDFFCDMETSGDNFLVPALKRLCQTTLEIDDPTLQSERATLCRILENRFSTVFFNLNDNNNDNDNDHNMAEETTPQHDLDEKPVVVPPSEIEASLARSTALTHPANAIVQDYPTPLRQKYPILFAAKMDHEDILMTCARALDDATDVSLVREARFIFQEMVI